MKEARTAVPSETQTQLRRAKDMLTKKDTEINMLRKESTWMKRELRERDEEIKALKATVKTGAQEESGGVPDPLTGHPTSSNSGCSRTTSLDRG